MAKRLVPRVWDEAATVAGFALGLGGKEALPSAKDLGTGRISARCSVALRRSPLSTGPARIFIPQNGLGVGRVGVAWTGSPVLLPLLYAGDAMTPSRSPAFMSGEVKRGPLPPQKPPQPFSPSLAGLGLGREEHPQGRVEDERLGAL